MYASQNQSIATYKLKRLVEDIESLEPGSTASIGKDKIVQQLRPAVSGALKRGCSPASIMGLISEYKLQLDTRELGINRQY